MKELVSKTKQYVKLSYDIGEESPLYPGTSPVVIERVKEISKGNSCNTFLITLSSHTGTHIDAPRHFYDSGRWIGEYSLDELVFRKPLLIDCPKGVEEIIEINDLLSLIDSDGFDLLLIRTGFYKYRSKDIYTYCHKNPCISPQAAEWVRNNFLNVRALGIDCISISSYANQELGRETHKILLKGDGFKGSPILIIEDLYIPYEISKLDELIVSPIFIENVDSSPCTVIGVIYE